MLKKTHRFRDSSCFWTCLLTKDICPNCFLYLSKLIDIFVKMAKHICQYCKLYLSKLPNIFVQIKRHSSLHSGAKSILWEMKAVCVKDLHGQAATAGGGQTHFVQAGKSARGSTSTLALQYYSIRCNCVQHIHVQCMSLYWDWYRFFNIRTST